MIYKYSGKTFEAESHEELRGRLKSFLKKKYVRVGQYASYLGVERIEHGTDVVNIKKLLIKQALDSFDSHFEAKKVEYGGATWILEDLVTALRGSKLKYEDGGFWLGEEGLVTEGYVDDIKETIIKRVLGDSYDI